MEYFLFIQTLHPFKITKLQNITIIKFRACSLLNKKTGQIYKEIDHTEDNKSD